MARQSFEKNVPVKIIFYDDKAENVAFTAHNYERVIGKLNTRGSTSFAAAFTATQAALDSFDVARVNDVVIAFMTDGCNNCGSFDSQLNSLKSKLRKLKSDKNIESVCHSIAFTSSHDFAFLDSLRKSLGTKEGGFQYAEESDGPQALQTKLELVFDVVASKTQAARSTLCVDGADFVVVDDSGETKLLAQLERAEQVASGEPLTINVLLRLRDTQRAPPTTLAATLKLALNGVDAPQTSVELALVVSVVPPSQAGALRAQMTLNQLCALEARVSKQVCVFVFCVLIFFVLFFVF